MIESLAGTYPVSADQLRNVVYQQFGLPHDFRFDFVFFTGGGEDVFSMTTTHEDDPENPGKKIYAKFAYAARLSKEKVDVTAGDFVVRRDAYINRLVKAFDCHFLDFGMGFPPSADACVTKKDVDNDLAKVDIIAQDGSAGALFRLVRLNCISRLEKWMGEEGKFWPKSKKVVAPFGWPYHDVTGQYVVDERHYGRLVMHILNAVTWVHWTYYCVEGKFDTRDLCSMRLCPGTPR
jgi:hypothetical protein